MQWENELHAEHCLVALTRLESKARGKPAAVNIIG